MYLTPIQQDVAPDNPLTSPLLSEIMGGVWYESHVQTCPKLAYAMSVEGERIPHG